MRPRNLKSVMDALRPYLKDSSATTELFVYEIIGDLADTEYSRGASENLRKYNPDEDGYVEVIYDRH
jgi:hypothetical protein